MHSTAEQTVILVLGDFCPALYSTTTSTLFWRKVYFSSALNSPFFHSSSYIVGLQEGLSAQRHDAHAVALALCPQLRVIRESWIIMNKICTMCTVLHSCWKQYDEMPTNYNLLISTIPQGLEILNSIRNKSNTAMIWIAPYLCHCPHWTERPAADLY
jgi:hypothetical protein